MIGSLPPYHTVTRYEVSPVVALVHPPFELVLQTGEVAEAFEVPLDFILDPANHQKRSRPWNGRMRHFYAMPYGGHFIWGATAAMLPGNLYHFLRATEPCGKRIVQARGCAPCAVFSTATERSYRRLKLASEKRCA